MLSKIYFSSTIIASLFVLSTVSLILSSTAAIEEEKNKKNDWIFVNHDTYGTRNSNQTTIGKDNVDKLEIKWSLLNDFEIQDPPIIIGDEGYVQDYAGNILAFDIRTGHIIWKISAGGGPTMGLAYDSGIIYASTASNASIVAVNATDGKITWESEMLGDPKVGYSIDASPIIWKD